MGRAGPGRWVGRNGSLTTLVKALRGRERRQADEMAGKRDFGGLEKGARVNSVSGAEKARRLQEYLELPRTRIWLHAPALVE